MGVFYIGLGVHAGRAAAVCSHESYTGLEFCSSAVNTSPASSSPGLTSVATSSPFGRPVQNTFATPLSFLGRQGSHDFSERAPKPGKEIRKKHYSKQTNASVR